MDSNNYDLLFQAQEFEHKQEDLFKYMWNEGFMGLRIADNNLFVSYSSEEYRTEFYEKARKIVDFLARVSYLKIVEEKKPEKKSIVDMFPGIFLR